MKVLNLRCAHDHRFEGWFASNDAFEAQQAGGLVECPVCGDTAATRLPNAPRLNVASLRDESTPAANPHAADPQAQMQSAWLQMVRHLVANTEDVGARFPEEARRIHYGEAQERGIRGRASREDADALREEGIEVTSLPVPPALKGPLQ